MLYIYTESCWDHAEDVDYLYLTADDSCRSIFAIDNEAWSKSPERELAIHFSEKYEGIICPLDSKQHDWVWKHLPTFTFRQLAVIALECSKDPDKFQRVVEEYHAVHS